VSTGQIADGRVPASLGAATRPAGLRGRLPLATRAALVESLDAGPVERGEMARNLADLARLALLPGGTGASIAAVAHLTGGGPGASIIDVGAGRGDTAHAFARRGWRTVALDSHPEVLDAARRAARDPLVEVAAGDARSLPYPDRAFDVGHCSLLLHHLDPADAISMLRELSRVSRMGVVVNDLRRGLLAFVATGVGVALLGRCRTTRVDGLISARRAYTLRELDALLAAAGLERRWRSPALLPRVATAAGRAAS
jgi:SAM-dependent methyltransferase